MKALYLTPIGTKVDLLDRSVIDGYSIVHMDPIRREITRSIREVFSDLELVEASDIFSEGAQISRVALESYDFILCDLTTSNANVLYVIGYAEACNKPVIYFIRSDSPYPFVVEDRSILKYSNQSIRQEFQAELHSLISSVLKDPLSLPNRKMKPRQTTAFISYSHRDKVYLDRLLVHLKPIMQKGLLDVWVDTRIKSGDRWKDAIKDALENASIAILLVSADFLASDFIVDNELPPLLSRAEVAGTRIIPVVLSPCRFARDLGLNRFQAVNSPARPLSSMASDERESIYDQLVQDIERALPTPPKNKSTVE